MEYYRTKKEHHAYKGIRFFRINPNSYDALQVCLSVGDVKKGKGNHVGIFLIGRETFVSNYYARYAERCTKKDFDKALDGLKKLFM